MPTVNDYLRAVVRSKKKPVNHANKYMTQKDGKWTYKRDGLEYTASTVLEIEKWVEGIRKARATPEAKNKRRFGLRYSTIGGVFQSSEKLSKKLKPTGTSVLRALAQKREDLLLEAPRKKLEQTKKPSAKDSTSHFGVEIEFISTLDNRALSKKMIEAKVVTFATLKGDGSIRTASQCPKCDAYDCECDRDAGECECECNCAESGVTSKHKFGHEITMVGKPDNITSRLERVLRVVNGPGSGRVNSSCGLHVHLDMRTRDAAKCFDRLTKAEPLLYAMVPKTRFTNDFCKPHSGQSYIQSIRGDRYYGINATAYNRHKTLEVRIHSGSTNFEKINHWILLLGAIADTEIRFDQLPAKPVNAKDLQAWLPVSDSTAQYVFERIEEFEGKRGSYGKYMQDAPSLKAEMVEAKAMAANSDIVSSAMGAVTPSGSFVDDIMAMAISANESLYARAASSLWTTQAMVSNAGWTYHTESTPFSPDDVPLTPPESVPTQTEVTFIVDSDGNEEIPF